MKHPLAPALAIVLLGSPLRADEKGQTFDANGVTIWYEERGGGPAAPLVVVNGGPGFDHVYEHLGDPVWDRLAQTRKVVFYDQRGNGRSSALRPGQSCTRLGRRRSASPRSSGTRVRSRNR